MGIGLSFRLFFFLTLKSKANWGVVWLFCAVLLSGLSLPLQVINSPACLFFLVGSCLASTEPHPKMLYCPSAISTYGQNHLTFRVADIGKFSLANWALLPVTLCSRSVITKESISEANKPVQSLPLLDILLRRNSLCIWIYSHRQDISTPRPTGY